MKELTGSFRFRNEGELLVLQVEETEYKPDYYGSGTDKAIWSDAKTEDLLNIEFSPKLAYREPIPSTGLAGNCSKCGLNLSNTMGYVCGSPDCPCGFGGAQC